MNNITVGDPKMGFSFMTSVRILKAQSSRGQALMTREKVGTITLVKQNYKQCFVLLRSVRLKKKSIQLMAKPTVTFSAEKKKKKKRISIITDEITP